MGKGEQRRGAHNTTGLLRSTLPRSFSRLHFLRILTISLFTPALQLLDIFFYTFIQQRSITFFGFRRGGDRNGAGKRVSSDHIFFLPFFLNFSDLRARQHFYDPA